MKYLDEDIVMTVTFPATVTGQYAYSLMMNSVAVFNGYCYVTNSSSIDIDVTDIMRSLQRSSKWVLTSGVTNVSNTYQQVTLALTYGQTYRYAYETVCFSYRYPHLIPSLNTTYTSLTTAERIMVQGVSNGNPTLVPRIPFRSTNNMSFRQLIKASGSTTNLYGVGRVRCTNTYNTTSGAYEGIVDSLSRFFGSAAIWNPGTVGLLSQVTSGVTTRGSAVWRDPKAGAFESTPGSSIPVHVWSVDANGNVLKMVQKNVNVRGLYEFVLEGDPDSAYIRIGNSVRGNYLEIKIDQNKLFGDPKNYYKVIFRVIEFDLGSGKVDFIDLNITADIADEAYIVGGADDKRIANIDICLADFYLTWIDRFGGIQTQPVSGKKRFTENFGRVTIEGYQGHRREAIDTITPKWSVNTGWIKESLMPYYESILVSPYLFLYDTKNDVEYRVICTDTSYEEKKYKNDRKMISIDLNLEVDKKQVILHN